MTAELAPGTRVRVRALHPPGHTRTPHYTRGRVGVVVGLADRQPDPESRAYGRDGLPSLPVYRVRFESRDLWPADAAGRDAVVVDLFQPWLEIVGDSADDRP